MPASAATARSRSPSNPFFAVASNAAWTSVSCRFTAISPPSSFWSSPPPTTWLALYYRSLVGEGDVLGTHGDTRQRQAGGGAQRGHDGWRGRDRRRVPRPPWGRGG